MPTTGDGIRTENGNSQCRKPHYSPSAFSVTTIDIAGVISRGRRPQRAEGAKQSEARKREGGWGGSGRFLAGETGGVMSLWPDARSGRRKTKPCVLGYSGVHTEDWCN